MGKRIQIKRWWRVTTGNSNSNQGDEVPLGTYFGYADDVALLLANKQSGFWCAGKLTFHPAEKPIRPKLRRTGDTVNIEFDAFDWKSRSDLMRKMKRLFRSRPVDVTECSQYGTVTLTVKQTSKRKRRS